MRILQIQSHCYEGRNEVAALIRLTDADFDEIKTLSQLRFMLKSTPHTSLMTPLPERYRGFPYLHQRFAMELIHRSYVALPAYTWFVIGSYSNSSYQVIGMIFIELERETNEILSPFIDWCENTFPNFKIQPTSAVQDNQWTAL